MYIYKLEYKKWMQWSCERCKINLTIVARDYNNTMVVWFFFWRYSIYISLFNRDITVICRQIFIYRYILIDIQTDIIYKKFLFVLFLFMYIDSSYTEFKPSYMKKWKISKAHSVSVVAIKPLENNKAWKILNFTKKMLFKGKKHFWKNKNLQ